MNASATEQALEKALKDLLLQVRQGDQTVYKKFLLQVAPVIRRAVYARLGRWGQQGFVEDITQDVLLAIHLKLHTYNAELDFLPWVRTVAKYKMIDFLRRQNKNVAISLDDEDVAEPVDETSQQDITATRDLNKLLMQLKPPAGEIIHALKVEGATVRELAAAYKMSEANIKVIVHRGLQKLAKLVCMEGKASA